jgi:transcriptional regulator with XRE-family HTH domain
MLTSIGERLAVARKRLGLTQEKASKAIGISREQLSYYETSQREVSLSTLAKLATLYGHSLEYFLGSVQEDEPLTVVFRADDPSEDDQEIIEWAKEFVIEAHELERLLSECDDLI